VPTTLPQGPRYKNCQDPRRPIQAIICYSLKDILSKKLPYFEKTFLWEKVSGTVELPNVEPEGSHILVSWIECDEIDLKKTETCQAIHKTTCTLVFHMNKLYGLTEKLESDQLMDGEMTALFPVFRFRCPYPEFEDTRRYHESWLSLRELHGW
jgi:hypothetical protein